MYWSSTEIKNWTGINDIVGVYDKDQVVRYGGILPSGKSPFLPQLWVEFVQLYNDESVRRPLILDVSDEAAKKLMKSFPTRYITDEFYAFLGNILTNTPE